MRRWDKRSQREMKEIAFHLDSRLVRDRHNGLRGILGSRDGAGFPREGGDASQVDALWMAISIAIQKKKTGSQLLTALLLSDGMCVMVGFHPVQELLTAL